MIDIDAQLTISRPTGHGCNHIKITVKDTNASVEFVSVRVPLEAFSEALTGLAFVECVAEVRNLGRVGKVMEFKQIQIKLPEDCSYDRRKSTAIMLAEQTLSDGWQVSDSLNSQGSFVRKTDGEYANVTLRRWV